MANILYMAISQDGFIAGPNDETPWSDAAWEAFQRFVVSCDVVLVGKRTFQIMQEQDEFVEGPRYIVVTDDEALDSHDHLKTSIHRKSDMPEADKVGIIGGGDLNGRLAKLGVIDEIILDIEPIKLHAGITLFGKHDVPLKLKLIESNQIGAATVQRHYQVLS